MRKGKERRKLGIFNEVIRKLRATGVVHDVGEFEADDAIVLLHVVGQLELLRPELARRSCERKSDV